MKLLTKLFLVAVLFLSTLTFVGQEASAESVTPGFYIKNDLKYSLSDFQKASKKEKKTIIKTMAKSAKNAQFVTSTDVYSFMDALLATEEELIKLGTPIDEYIAANGPLTDTSVSVTLFEVIGIE